MIRRFKEVQGLQTLRFVEDLELSTRANLELGVTRFELNGSDAELQPTGSFSFADRRLLTPTIYGSLRAGGAARMESGDAVGWTANARLTAFDRRFDGHAIGLSAFWRQADESQGLPAQLTLGEGSGLRGYPARQFTGTRVVGLNVEDRIDLDASLGALELGAAVFFDAGWAGEPGEGFGRPFTSVGAGLRVGSSELFGSGVLRLDLSFPLDDVPGESFDSPLISFSLGQVFGL